MKKILKFTAGALLGASIASITIILLAPQSGSESRAKLVQGASFLKNQFTKAVDNQRRELEKELGGTED